MDEQTREKLNKVATWLDKELTSARYAHTHNAKPEVQQYHKGRIEALRETMSLLRLNGLIEA